MPGKEPDTAALLIGVFAVGLGPLINSGNWDPINTIVCIPVLVVLWVYSLNRGRRTELLTSERLAVAMVLGFIVSIGFSWPAQTVLGAGPIDAYYAGLLPGCLTVIVLWCLWPRSKQEPQPNDASLDLELPGSIKPEEVS